MSTLPIQEGTAGAPEQPSLDQLLKLIQQQKAQQDQLAKVAAKPATGQPIAQEGQSRWDILSGQNVDPAQRQQMMSMYTSILNRGNKNAMGAAGSGFMKGRQLMDQMREREKGEQVAGLETGLAGNREQMELLGDAIGVKRQQEQDAYSKERDKTKDDQWLKDFNQGKETRVFASQVKNHENLQTAAYEANISAASAQQLSQDIDAIAAGQPAGLASDVSEWMKQASGNRDQVSQLRTKAIGLINSQVVKNLPKGPASDKDIAIIKAGFTPENASLQEMKDFADAVARTEARAAEYYDFAQRYVGENDYDSRGLPTAWEKHQEQLREYGKTPAASGGGAVVDWDSL